jgi:hypothetical protein
MVLYSVAKPIILLSAPIPALVSAPNKFLRFCIVPGPCFLGLLDPDPVVRGVDPDPSIIKLVR